MQMIKKHALQTVGLWFACILWVLPSSLHAEDIATNEVPETGAEGVIIDAETGETLPFVQLYFMGTGIGTTSDMDGQFAVKNNQGLITLTIQMIGYKTEILTLTANKIQRDMVIKLQPDIYGLQDVVVTPKSAKKERYKRKGNPAVELIKNVIAHKDSNRIEHAGNYQVDTYEKLIMALDKFDVDFEKNAFNKKFAFLQQYIDTAQFDATPVLTISLRETLAKEYYQDKKHLRYVEAKRMQGVDKILDQEGLSTNLDAMFTRMNIFDNDIELMLNRFVSPLSSSMAVSYYRYYIMDTIMVDGTSCIDLAFVPVNSQNYGFTGHLYVVNDSSYALKKYAINVPPHINMNFVSDLSIEQEFERLSSGEWTPKELHNYVRFYLFKKMRQVYAHQTVNYIDYQVGATPPDTLFQGMNADIVEAKNARQYTHNQWTQMRPQPLTGKEAFIDSIMIELRRIPSFNAVIKTVEIVGSGYAATNKDRNKSYFDFGPLWNTISYNNLEGVRLRVGGMTTANLHNRWFMNGYIALGCKDLRVKYNAMLIHSFVEKEYHPFESLRHALYLSTYYDVEVPGQSYAYIDRDNLFLSFNFQPLRNMQYVRRTKLRYEKEWANRFSLDTWVQHENNEAAGTLQYHRILADGSTARVKYFNAFEAGVQLRWAPGEPLYNNRLGKESVFNLAKDAPVIRLSHTVGYMDKFWYNRTNISAEKRFWLSSFGHIDMMLQSGIIWNRVPFPKLYVPQSNQSLFLTPNTFNMMRPMEFVMDQYVALHAIYYMKGWIFNRIPYWNRLKLREVISFSGIYGGLSRKNNPLLMTEGLYTLPEGTSPMGKLPYLEMTVGVENILKFIRIDYVRRLTYTEGLSGWQLNGIRFTFRFSL